MKIFIITTVVVLAVALLAAVGLFWYLNSTITAKPSSTASSSVPVTAASTTQVQEFTTEQSNRLEAVGIDPESVTLTDETITCAKDVLGEARSKEIAAGAEPTLIEIGKLLGCL